MLTVRRANIIGDQAILDCLPSAAFNVRSWQSGVAPRTQAAVEAMARDKGWITERVPGAPRRYILFLYYATPDGFRVGRRNCFTTLAAAPE